MGCTVTMTVLAAKASMTTVSTEFEFARMAFGTIRGSDHFGSLGRRRRNFGLGRITGHNEQDQNTEDRWEPFSS